MVVLIVESAPPGLRGELSKWMLEPKAGVFVGTVSATVRDLLWKKACEEVGAGGCTMIYRTNNEQGFAIRTWGDRTREVEEWEGLFLVRRPFKPVAIRTSPLNPSDDWNDHLYPEIWAKTSRGVKLAPDEGHYHPLCCHMIDTAMVARRLWQCVLPRAVRDEVRRQLGLSSDDAAGRWMAFFAGLHDLGKATPAFARQWPEGWEILVRLNYGGAPGTERKAHQILTTFLLERLLADMGLPIGVAVPVAAVLGGHHGLFPTARQLKHANRYTGTGRWLKAQTRLVGLLAHVTGVDQLPPLEVELWRASSVLVILAGLTTVSDWIASNHDCFPYAGDQVRLPQYARRARWRAWIALHQLGWLYQPRVESIPPFQEMFDKVPNRLQRQVIDLAPRLRGPSLVLLEYPMGGGKTEAALYLADYLAAAAGHQGAYFALPTMATSNQMFSRVKAYLADRFPGHVINTQLLHGHASLSAEFELLRQAASQTIEGRQDRRRRLDLAAVGESDEATVLAAEWFTYKKRGLLAPWGIGTIDQALLAILQTKHFFVRLFGLAGKVVILDEVHAYDTYMQSLLTRLLTWLAACGTSVVLLSATLPSHTRRALVAAYAAGRDLPALPASSAPYPRITWVTEGGAGEVHIPGTPTRRISLRRYVQTGGEWISDLKAALRYGGCAAVIVNTVTRAQAVYHELRNHFPAEELYLFHARYPFSERLRREEEVLSRFGRDGVDRPHRAVVVATQVIEQSLDLDFDLMITDLAPADLIFQRSGRLWRHRRQRPTGFQEPTLWLLMPDVDDTGVPQFERGSELIYDSHTLLRSWLVLSHLEYLEIPDALEELVEAVYEPSDPPDDLPETLRSFWQTSRAELEEEQQRDRQQAARRYIPDVSKDFLHMSMDDLEEEGESHPALQALTRLGGPSVTVICLIEEDGRLWTLGPERREIRLEKRPDTVDIRALLGSSIRISFDRKLVHSILAENPVETWEASAHLRRCRLLRFDPDGHCLTSDLPLRLDPELGLVRLRGREEEAA